ncbi:hypothetical protein ACS0TY_017258 [Phlomoides rotata]
MILHVHHWRIAKKSKRPSPFLSSFRVRRASQSRSPSNMDLCRSVKNILLLDSDGKRVAAKYYSEDWPSNSARESFEKAVFPKTQKTNARSEDDKSSTGDCTGTSY